MNMKKVLIGGVVVSTIASSAVYAGEISANVALTTDYVWRGISQNQEDPALQGGFDYAHDSGFYLGAWAANVNFGGAVALVLTSALLNTLITAAT